MTTLAVGPSSIHVEDHGDGRPIVALHSSGLSGQQWRMLRSRVVPPHRLLAPDFLGCGRSTPFPEVARDGFDTLVDVEIAEAVAALGGQPVHLVGHSYGGFIAMRVALRGRVPLASLSLFEPVTFGVLTAVGDRDGAADLDRLNADGSDFFDLTHGGLEGWMRRFVDYWQAPGAWEALPAPSRAAMLKSADKAYAEVRSLVNFAIGLDELRALAVPTLFMTGGKSPLAAQRVCQALARTLPNARLEVLADAGHMGPLMQARVVNDLVAGWIEAH